MFDYRSNSNEFIKKSSKLLNNVFKQNYENSFLIDNLINDLYEELLKLVPKKIAVSASVNSKDSFKYFLNYSIEDITLILKNNNDNWSLCYIVNASYLDNGNKLLQDTSNLSENIMIINLKDFYEKNVKKYYH